MHREFEIAYRTSVALVPRRGIVLHICLEKILLRCHGLESVYDSGPLWSIIIYG